MKAFINKYSSKIKGMLSGFDRIVIKGTLKRLSYVEGMLSFLLTEKVLLKDFGNYVEKKTKEFKERSYSYVKQIDRPIEYLATSGIRKNEYAKEIAKKHSIDEGLICLLTSVEPFYGYAIFKNRGKKKLELIKRERKCLHFYYYWNDPVFGFMGSRVQTWFPYSCYFYINGREWLEKMLIKKGIGYQKVENCFLDVSDFVAAQELFMEQLQLNWPKMLDEFAYKINPLYKEFKEHHGLEYYWTTHQSEWATDIVFQSREELQQIYASLVRDVIALYSAEDVMRFLGKKLHGNFKGELTTHYKERPEGVRIKHSVKGNSVKLYDKQSSILRVETTINNPYCFKMYRPKEGASDTVGIYPLRKSVADIYRRCHISEGCNQRYLDAIASLESDEPFYKLISPICVPTEYNNRRARALRPWEKSDSDIFHIIGNGEFILNGFRNRDIREKLFPELKEKEDVKKASSKITRYLWLLRAHGLIRKIPKTHRYQLTDSGRKIIPAVLKTFNLSMEQLAKVA